MSYLTFCAVIVKFWLYQFFLLKNLAVPYPFDFVLFEPLMIIRVRIVFDMVKLRGGGIHLKSR